jgi:hypothetical protein
LLAQGDARRNAEEGKRKKTFTAKSPEEEKAFTVEGGKGKWLERMAVIASLDPA